MTESTDTAPASAAHGYGCWCPLHTRRRMTGLLLAGAAVPAAAAIPECKRSGFTKMVSAEQVEQGASQQYARMMQQAQGQHALARMDHPQLQRLRYIAERIIPFAPECNERARSWRWEVNLIGSQDLNAFCMPGGKIAFFYGILSRLQLNDDEVATIMGHEAAHALLEHAREQTGKSMATSGVLRLGAAALGLGNLGDLGAQIGSNLLSLKFSRTDETEADALGLVMAARAGYDPSAGVSLWKKMMAATGSRGGPAFLSTHPAGPERIADIESRLARVLPEYQAAAKPAQRFGPPPPPKQG